MRSEYVAGERLFVDFCGDTLTITDPETGQPSQASVFACALGASGYLYVEATGSQDLANWLGAHVNALTFYGGSDRAIVPANLKSRVPRTCSEDPGAHPGYAERAESIVL